MKKIISLLFAIIITCGASFAKQGTEIKIISYNIRTLARDGSNSWQFRKHATANMLHRHAPDAFGLQEAMVAHLQYIDSVCPEYARVGVGRDDGKMRGEFMAIYYNKERFDLLDSGTFWLSETPEQVSKGWDAACVRTTTWVKLRDKDSSKEFYFFNTHLDHKGRVAQTESVKLIKEKIREISGEEATVILGGDFNVTPEDEVLAPLDGFMQAARTTAETADDKGTFNGWGKRKVKSVIDHVFYRGGTAECHTYRILDGDYGAPYISDHYPVEVVFSF